MDMLIQQPPALQGDEKAQLAQLYRYLYRLAEQLNAASGFGGGGGQNYLPANRSGSGGDEESGSSTQVQLDAQYRELKALILKTADTIYQRMDKIITSLSSEFVAASDDWGTFRQNILRMITETAESTVEQFNFNEAITSELLGLGVIEGVDGSTEGEYQIASAGYIKRGIIGFDDENFPIYGIAIGETLRSKKVTVNGYEYEVIDTTESVGTYTDDQITFWKNGQARAWFDERELFTTDVRVSNSICIGDWRLMLTDENGLLIANSSKLIGASLDLSANERMAFIVGDGKSGLEITQTALNAIAKNIDLRANDSIRLAVSGGRNLILNSAYEDPDLTGTGWRVRNSCTISIDSEEKYNNHNALKVVGNASSGGLMIYLYGYSPTVTKFRNWEQYVLSFMAKGSTAHRIGVCYGMAPTDGMVYADIGTEWKRYELVLPITETTYDTDLIVNSDDATAELYLAEAKLESGTSATGWSPAPEDPAYALQAGTSVKITKDEFRVVAPETVFAIPAAGSEDGEEIVSIDDEGIAATAVTADVVSSPSVVATQAAVSLKPANGGELEAIVAGLCNKFLLGDVIIDASAVTGGAPVLTGMAGGGRLQITGGTLNGFTAHECNASVRLASVKFETSGTALDIADTKVALSSCTINAGTGLDLQRWARVMMANCTGTCTTLAHVIGDSRLRCRGTMPTGKLTPDPIQGDVITIDPVVDSPSAPVVPTITTFTLPATLTKTWRSGWRSGNDLYQGKYGNTGFNRGCMWFDLSSISGKTIQSATLVLRRASGSGNGGSVTANIYGTTATGASGTPAIGTKYASVALVNGATKSVDVTEAVKALAAGTIKGLMLYDDDEYVYNGKQYTTGYAKFYGSGSGSAPALSVTIKA